MVAYNHYIKFVPEISNDKKVRGLFVDTITVQESTHNDLEGKLIYELTFFNNQGRDLTLYTDREFSPTKKGQLWAFEVKGVVTFLWYSGTLNLVYIKHDNFTEKLLEYWSLHIVLPLFFTIEDIFYFLHAGAVEVDGNPILFIAESFGGKSTMTDFFMKQGHKMISDDKVGVYEGYSEFYAISSHPYHRPYRKMEELGFFIENFTMNQKPIHVIYELEKSDANSQIQIIKLNGVEKFTSLRHASEMNLFFQNEQRFNFLMKMLNIVPVYKVTVPWDIQRLQEVHDLVCKHSIECI